MILQGDPFLPPLGGHEGGYKSAFDREQSGAKFIERSRNGVPVPEPLLAALDQLGGKPGIGKLG